MIQNLSKDILDLTAAHWSNQLSSQYKIDLTLTSMDVSVMLLLMEQAKLIEAIPEVEDYTRAIPGTAIY